MRKILLSLTVLAAATLASAGAEAAPVTGRMPVLDVPAQVQTVQYHRGEWRRRAWIRHERRAEWRRHEWRREHRHW